MFTVLFPRDFTERGRKSTGKQTFVRLKLLYHRLYHMGVTGDRGWRAGRGRIFIPVLE